MLMINSSKLCWYDAFCIDCYICYLLYLQICYHITFAASYMAFVVECSRFGHFCFQLLSWYVFEKVFQFANWKILADLLCALTIWTTSTYSRLNMFWSILFVISHFFVSVIGLDCASCHISAVSFLPWLCWHISWFGSHLYALTVGLVASFAYWFSFLQ